QAEREIDCRGRFAYPALARSDGDDRLDARYALYGLAARRAARGHGSRALRRWTSGRRARFALCRQPDESRSHARQRAHNLFRALAHRFPSFDIGSIDGDGKEHLAVASDHLRKRAGSSQRHPLGALYAFEGCEHLFLGHRHRRILRWIIANRHHKGRAGPVNVMTVDVRPAPSQSLPHIGIHAVAWQCSRRTVWRRWLFSVSASWGTLWQGTSRTRAATTSPCITAPRPRRRSGWRNTAGAAQRRPKRRPRARTSSCAVSATTTTCARSRWGRTAPSTG